MESQARFLGFPFSVEGTGARPFSKLLLSLTVIERGRLISFRSPNASGTISVCPEAFFEHHGVYRTVAAVYRVKCKTVCKTGREPNRPPGDKKTGMPEQIHSGIPDADFPLND
jgi:hypothetical protein